MTEGKDGDNFLFDRMCSIVGSEHVAIEEFARRAYTRAPFYSIGGGGRGKTPGIVVRPVSTGEVSEIVKLANETGTPIVPKGGGGSVSTFPPRYVGGDNNILIDTHRMNRILDIGRDYMTVTAECGVILSQLS